jgi:hypothetical protein
MFEHRQPVRLVAAVVLLFAFTASAIGQQSPQPPPTPAPTPARTHQINKVMRQLGRFDPGTKLDVQLHDGSHKIGKVSETGSTSFVLIDSVSGAAQTIDYLDVKRVQPTRKEYAAQQLHKTANSLPKLLIIVGVTFAVMCGVALLNGDK